MSGEKGGCGDIGYEFENAYNKLNRHKMYERSINDSGIDGVVAGEEAEKDSRVTEGCRHIAPANFSCP
jgi:hypothetical protein